jgi:hypothetical protein
MYRVELYREVWLTVVDGRLSQRAAAWQLGIDRLTVTEVLGHAAPPGYPFSNCSNETEIPRRSEKTVSS